MGMLQKTSYSIHKLKGLPFIGLLLPLLKDPLHFTMKLSQRYGDIICFKIMGRTIIQLNHPDLIYHVLVANHKNYIKSKPYIRFQSALGFGLLTSSGEKWKRDRQRIQPMFNREKIAGHYYDTVNAISEKYKHKWLAATEHGAIEIDFNEEVERITTEVILKSIYGNDIDEDIVSSLHHSYGVLVAYLGRMRLFPKIDLRKLFCTPAYFKFKKALQDVDMRLKMLTEKYKKNEISDPRNLLALLIEAQKKNPDHFNDTDIRDHCATMVFAAFETTTIFIQWFWYMLDERADIKTKLRANIVTHAACTATHGSESLAFSQVQAMDYLSMVMQETMRLYPSFWLSGREPIEDDFIGDFKIPKGTAVALPQIAMHRHPLWWENPNSCIPERFLPENEAIIPEGVYFPFSLGPRKCSGNMFAEMEAKTIIAKLLPLFDMTVLNKLTNPMHPGISLKLKQPMIVRISRALN